jgi:hypothetical protein
MTKTAHPKFGSAIDQLGLEDSFGASKHFAMNYDPQWRNLRKRNRLWWSVFLGLIPAIILIGFALDLISPELAKRTSDTIFFYAWMAAFAAASIYAGGFRCPRCGKRYFRTRLGGVNAFARKCPHCGLPKWASNEQTSN